MRWGWPAAPTRTLIFPRDIPQLPHPLPRYLPPDADRRLTAALEALSAPGAAPRARLHADALLLTRATGLRIGELRELELDCVHEIDGHGAWLKVPLGKLATERMVPLDDETVAVLDRIAARRTPGRPLPHPRTGRPVEFLLVHQGRRISAQALRAELTRAATEAGLKSVTPHQLRHTYATALVNAGVSLQALMQLLGHVSATMSLRYGQLFDATVRAEYERALTQAKAQLGPAPLAGMPRRTVRAGATADGHHRRRRLERQPHHQIPARRRLLPARPRPGNLRLRQHLRTLPELPHRHRVPRRARRATRRRRRPGRRRRNPRLDSRSQPAPPTRRPPRRTDHPHRSRPTMTDPDTDTARIQAACERLLAAGRDVTFTAVAETSGISRATCYRRRELREIIDRYRSRHGELLTITGLATRLDNLTQVLDAVAAKVRRQEEEIRSLKRATPQPPRRSPRND